MDEYERIESTARQLFASVVWSHKIQEKQADIYEHEYKLLESIKIGAASATSIGIVSLLFTDQYWIKIVSALISFVSVFISAYFKSFDLSSMKKQHKNSAINLWGIREDLLLLILQIRNKSITPESAIDLYKNILERLKVIYEQAPNTTEAAVRKAGQALNVAQDNTFSDSEIDSFLPDMLRRD